MKLYFYKAKITNDDDLLKELIIVKGKIRIKLSDNVFDKIIEDIRYQLIKEKIFKYDEYLNADIDVSDGNSFKPSIVTNIKFSNNSKGLKMR